MGFTVGALSYIYQLNWGLKSLMWAVNHRPQYSEHQGLASFPGCQYCTLLSHIPAGKVAPSMTPREEDNWKFPRLELSQTLPYVPPLVAFSLHPSL